MIDKSHIGLRLEPVTTFVETGQLKLFAKATGQTNPCRQRQRTAGLSSPATQSSRPTRSDSGTPAPDAGSVAGHN